MVQLLRIKDIRIIKLNQTVEFVAFASIAAFSATVCESGRGGVVQGGSAKCGLQHGRNTIVPFRYTILPYSSWKYKVLVY